jgi:hypothetical protein
MPIEAARAVAKGCRALIVWGDGHAGGWAVIESAGHRQVAQLGDAERGQPDTISLCGGSHAGSSSSSSGQGVFDPGPHAAVDGVEFLLPGRQSGAVGPLPVRHDHPVPWYPPSAITVAPTQERSTVDSVKARQSLRFPGSGLLTATTSRVFASMTTCTEK